MKLEQYVTTAHGKHEHPSISPLLVSVDEASTALRLGRTKIYALMQDGVLPYLKIGKRRLVAVSALTALVEKLQAGEVR